MNKYPECCYRIGNVIKVGENKNVFLGADNDGHQRYDRLKNHAHEFVSITAETLAELARDNGEYITSMGHDKFNKLEKDRYLWYVRTDVPEAPFFYQLISEPLGEFFLSVALERKYIT